MKVRIIVESRGKLSIGLCWDQVAEAGSMDDAFLLARMAAEAYLPQPEGIVLRTIVDVVPE